MQKDETWDVVIVGGGASGLAAGVTAASPNCHVLLLEKCSALGGTSALAIGSVTAAGTKLQYRAGVQDSPEDFLREVDDAISARGLKERTNKELTEVLIRNAADAVDWITNLGASFVGPFHEALHPVPRMHSIVPNSKSYISVLRQAAIKKGVTIRTESPVHELITSGDSITGVKVISSSGVRMIRANRGIILATGDYTSNKEMKTKFMSEELAQVEGINPASTGDGHLMAMAVGAAVRNMDYSSGPNLRFISPSRPLWIESLPTFPALAKLMGAVAKHAPRSFYRFIAKRFLTVHTSPSANIFKKGAILINKDGKRFTNELQNAPLLAAAVARQPGKIAYIFIDAVLARIFSMPPNYISTAPGIAYAYFDDYSVLRKDIVYTGQTVSQLAKRLSIDPVTLMETVDRNNRSVAVGKDNEFGQRELDQGLHEAPFYVLGPLIGCYSTVEGGLRVDSKCHVLTTEGKIIPRLYAVGDVGHGGLILFGHGMHIAWALVSGRIAGRNAREEMGFYRESL
jgi:succinate dehydrogenase/fumarate reductase flavoprotein subunit